jgi:RimJ/RimL family protein N-acetyltransferase
MPRRLAHVDLAGELVRLRPHRDADAAPAYALLAGVDEILRWLVWDGPASPEELAEHYSTWCVERENGTDLRLALEERASGTLVGSLSLRFTGHPGQADLGYWIGVPFQRRGLGREALALAAHLAFHHLGAHALHAWVFVGNGPSRSVLERTGFTLARTVPGRVLKQGARVDEWNFVLLASEWHRRAAAVQPLVQNVTWSEVPARSGEEPPASSFP